MTTNPFITQPSSPIVENFPTPPADDFATEDFLPHDSDPPPGEFGTPRQKLRFFKLLGLASAIFLLLVFSVLREITHSRELFRMSQLVSTSESQRRLSLEQQRLGEVRQAVLFAELLRLQTTPRNPRIVGHSYVQIKN